MKPVHRARPNVPGVDQSDRLVPRNLRQSGPTPVQMLISTRVRKSPFWHLSIEAGCWRATVYNRMYHPRGYVKPEDGGAMAEYDVLVSQTGFSGEKGYEIYVHDSSLNAEAVWYELRGQGARYGLRAIAPAHHRRIAAGLLSWGQDMDIETSPLQVNLAYQVPRKKEADYIGRAALEAQRAAIDEGRSPFKLKLVGLAMGGKPITDYAPGFWLIATPEGERVGYVTSPWWSPELKHNIALGFVPWEMSGLGNSFLVELPEAFVEASGQPVDAEVVEVPFRPSKTPSARERARAAGRDWAP